MNVVELGSGPAVLLLHGSPSPLDDLLPIAHELAPDHRVLLPYLPGYGASAPVDDASYAHVGTRLAGLLADRGIGRLRAIIGYSSGAYRALDLVALRGVRSERVLGLAPLAYIDEATAPVLRAGAAALRADPHGAAIRAALPARWLSARWRAAHPEDDARVASWLDAAMPAALAAELEAQAEAVDLRPLLGALATEIHLRVGALDVACPPAWSHEIARLATHATVDEVPGVGHALLVEDPVGTLRWIVDHIR